MINEIKQLRLILSIVVTSIFLLSSVLSPLVQAADPLPLTLKWRYYGIPTSTGGPLILDVDGDGYEDIICAGNSRVQCLSGKSTATNVVILWNVNVAGAMDDMDTQTADVNGDGFPEIIVTLQKPAGIVALNARTGATLWIQNNNGKGFGGSIWGSPAVADVNGDGYPEIFVGAMCTTVNKSCISIGMTRG